jgi:hypothetical protein
VTRGVVVAAAALAAGCLPPAGLETARVAPRGTRALTVGGEVATTSGKRHDYHLRDRAGNASDVDNQHQPWFAGEASVVGRASMTVLPRVELELSGWNPLLFPPVGVGAGAGARMQLLGGDTGPFALALGARGGGFVHAFGESGNSRKTAIGLLEARAVASFHPWTELAVVLSPRIRFEAMHETFSDSFGEDSTIDYTGGSSRAVPGAVLGLALRSYFFDVDVSGAPRGGDDPGFVRAGVAIGRRLER